VITSNVLTRVFRLKCRTKCGTCFTVDRAGRQYIVTAAHIVEGIGESDTVALLRGDTWIDVTVALVGTGGPEIDIAVLAPNVRVSPTYEVRLGGTLLLGQDVFFLGFPYGLQTPAAFLNRGFQFPLVKKATVSSLQGQQGETQYMLLDGIINPGFSGGPVACTPAGLVFPQLLRNAIEFCFVGVVSGYRFEWEPTYLEEQKTPMAIKANTGIVIAYDIHHAIDMIDRSPIGYQLSAGTRNLEAPTE